MHHLRSNYLRSCILLFLFLLLGCYANSQTSQQTVDTIPIYKNTAGIKFKNYMRTWFFGYGIRHTYSWPVNKLNKQDSSVVEFHPPRYFKVYDSKNRLMLEGQTGEMGLQMEGNVFFYHNNGNLKRIEHWNYNQIDTSCTGTLISLGDGPRPESTWKYFRKNGLIKKQADYMILVYSCNPLSYCTVKQITRFRKNGKALFVRTNKLRCSKNKNGA